MTPSRGLIPGSGPWKPLDYLQSLWDRIAATPETIPVPDWHREILDERLKDLEADGVPVFTDDVASSNYPVFKGPATL